MFKLYLYIIHFDLCNCNSIPHKLCSVPDVGEELMGSYLERVVQDDIHQADNIRDVDQPRESMMEDEMAN